MTNDKRYTAARRVSDVLCEVYDEALHPSGMRVLICPKDISMCFAVVGIDVGAADVPIGETFPVGVAHFLEHMLFRDEEPTLPGIEINAATGYDRTTYFASCTGEANIPSAIRALMSLLWRLTASEDTVECERAIIAEEIRMDADNPAERCYEAMRRAMYHIHPIREDICGSEASLATVTSTVLQRFFDRYYTPNDMVLAVCGQICLDEVMTVLDEFLPATSAEPRTVSAVYHEPRLVRRPYTELRMAVSKPMLCMGIKVAPLPEEPPARALRKRCMSLLSLMLFSESEDLYGQLYDMGLITTGVDYEVVCGKGYAHYVFTCETDCPAQVCDVIRDRLATLRETGLSPASFERARRLLYAEYVAGFDSGEDIAYALVDSAWDGESLFDGVEGILRLTFQEVSRVFLEDICDEYMVCSVVMPQENPHDG